MTTYSEVDPEGMSSVEDYLEALVKWEQQVRGKFPGTISGEQFRRCQLLCGDEEECAFAMLTEEDINQLRELAKSIE